MSLREIGTLIVVVLKANHLPNKRHIGKQDPYCLAIVNGEKKRTKAIKRGGQHPEWDEELRFTLFEDDDDLSATSAPGTPPPLPPKDASSSKNIQGGNTMKIACYADDPREPDLIGETEVDLTEVLTKGETDEWFTLSNKDKFAGKVYLELTFWSNAPPPEKKSTPKPPKPNKQYAGPGSFVPSTESPSRVEPSGAYAHSRPSSDTSLVAVPSSIRASDSLTKLDLYVPPYEKPTTTVLDQIASEFSELRISQHRRRESFPPVQYGYVPAVASNPYLGEAIHAHDRPFNTYDSHPQYHYDPNQSPAPARNSRLPSIPISSSGFMPLNNGSTFSSSAHTSDPFAYPPLLSHTPAPLNSVVYQPITNYLSPQVPLPLPHNTTSYIPSTTPTPYAPPAFQPQLQPYSPYPPPQNPAPPQQYAPPVMPPQGHSQSPYPAYQPVFSSSHESIPMSNSTSSVNGTSRPLPPEPHIVYASPHPSIGQTNQEGIPPPPPVLPLPPPPPPPVQYSQIPPPPPIPNPPTYPVNGGSPVPPPPPPLLTSTQMPPRRRASLPVPPGPLPPQQLPYQPPPPPPLPVNAIGEYPPASIPPSREPNYFSPGPPPKPPIQLDHTSSQMDGMLRLQTVEFPQFNI